MSLAANLAGSCHWRLEIVVVGGHPSASSGWMMDKAENFGEKCAN